MCTAPCVSRLREARYSIYRYHLNGYCIRNDGELFVITPKPLSTPIQTFQTFRDCKSLIESKAVYSVFLCLFWMSVKGMKKDHIIFFIIFHVSLYLAILNSHKAFSRPRAAQNHDISPLYFYFEFYFFCLLS